MNDLYVPPPQDTPQQNEAAAKQLTSATFNSFGTMPNPQLVYEAIKTQSTVPIAQAIQSGDPQYRSVVSASLAGGGSMPVLAGGQQPQQQQQSDVWKIDWKGFWDQNKAALKDDKNASFKSFGEVPVNNLGYMQGVAQQTDPNRIRQWQQLLQHGGFMDAHASPTGVWDQSTQAAFQGFMISRAMPDALFGQGSAETNARLFLSQLGVDTAKMDQQRSDPTFLGQVARQWVAAQGPDTRVGDKSLLQSYADQYGESNLPTSYQQLVHENVLDWIRGGMSIFADVPVLGRATDVYTNIITGNFIQHPGDIAKDPRAIRADSITSQMTADEKAALAPAIQSVAQDGGIMGLFDAYDRIRTKGLLAVGYAFGDAFSGRGVENPFDSNSAANRGAEAHASDFIAGIMGDKWAHDHSVIAAIGNFALNVVDDPISYIPIVDIASVAEKVPAVAKAGRAAARAGSTAFGVVTPPVGIYRLAKTGTLLAPVSRTARDLVRPEIRAQIDAATDTLSIRQRQTLSTMKSVAEHPDSHGTLDHLHLVNENSTGELARDRIALVQKLAQGDTAESVQLMQDEFGYINALPNSHFNRKAWLKQIGPEMHAKISAGGFSAMRTMGAFAGDGDNLVKLWSDPIAAAKKFEQRAVAAGMKAPEIKRYGDMLLHNTDPNKVFEIKATLGRALNDALKAKHGDKFKDFQSFIQKMRSGRSFHRTFDEQDQVKLLGYAEEEAAPRAPTMTATATAEENAVKMSELLQLQKFELAKLEENGHYAATALGHAEGSPEYVAAMNEYKATPEYKEMDKEAQSRVQMIRQEIEQISRPAPVSSTQLADEAKLPYSTYEILAYAHPALRRMESVQHHIYLDAVMGTWKRLVLARAATSMRITLGDDAIRAILDLAVSGHPVAATKLTGKTLVNIGKSITPGLQKGVVARSKAILEQQAQTMRKYLSDLDDSAFVPYMPEHGGYGMALTHVVDNLLAKDPMVSAWAKDAKALGPDGGKKAIRDWYTSDDPEARAMQGMYHTDVAPAMLDHVVDKTHDYLSAFATHPQVLDWLAGGAVDEKQLAKLLADPATRAAMPKIVARRQTSFSDNVLLRTMGKPTDWLYHHITEPMVNAARAEGLLAQRAMAEKRIRQVHGATWDEPKIVAMAESMSRDWLTNNTYQGSRSVMGSALRNAFPFWGATANMNRFYMRQVTQKPFLADVLLRGAAKFEESNKQQNGHMTLGSSILSHIGFSGGTALSFNPAHMLFITSDGIGSMVPGFGPLFTPLVATLAHDQHLAEILADIPGLGTQINYQTGAAQPMYPWIADLISGVGMELPGVAGDIYNRSIGSIPMLTQSKEEIDRQTENKLKQMSGDKGRAATPEDIAEAKREVGRQLLMAGGLSFAIPMTPRVFDERQQGVNTALTAWGQAQTDDQKDQVIAGALGVDVKQWQDALSSGDVNPLLAQHPDSPAQLLAYRDRRINAQTRDQIAEAAPWVLPYDTSEWETTQKKPQNIEQFRFSRSQGNIHLLSPDEYVGRVSDNVDVNQGWLAYDGLKQQEFNFLRDHQVDTSSQIYKDWHKTVFESQLTEISKEHRVWAKIHNQTAATDMAGRTENTSRLSSVMTWQVIPQHSDFETKTSTLWRQALVWRDEAAGAITALHGVSGSAAQRDLILQGLQQRLKSLGEQDPVFKRQLNQFTFGNVSDLVDLESMQMNAANTPVPQ